MNLLELPGSVGVLPMDSGVEHFPVVNEQSIGSANDYPTKPTPTPTPRPN